MEKQTQRKQRKVSDSLSIHLDDHNMKRTEASVQLHGLGVLSVVLKGFDSQAALYTNTILLVKK